MSPDSWRGNWGIEENSAIGLVVDCTSLEVNFSYAGCETYAFTDRRKRLGMPEAWIQISCPNCEDYWEENPTDLPSPEETFQCPKCGATQPVSEFMRAKRDLEVLQEFHTE